MVFDLGHFPTILNIVSREGVDGYNLHFSVDISFKIYYNNIVNKSYRLFTNLGQTL